jgi:Na+-transporting NADH:ubiquinone oxidoreductase subunit D
VSRTLFRLIYTKPYALAREGVWRSNPILTAAPLGVCSALAVTNRVANGIAMGMAVTFVVIAASMITSAIRDYIPQRIRMVTYMIIISTFVIGVDLFFKGFFPEISRSLGPYVALIITNCIIMGRSEAFASRNRVSFSTLDALSHGLGYTFTLLILSAFREVLAFGTLLNVPVVWAGWTNWVVMAMAPGGFFFLAIIVWIARTLQREVEVAEPQKIGTVATATTIAASAPGAY